METTIFGWSWTTRPRDVKSQFWMLGVRSWLLVPLFWHPCFPPNLVLVISHIIICLYIRTYIYIYLYIYYISMENQPFIDVKTNVLPIFRCTGHHRSSQLRPGCRTVAEIIVVSHHGSTGRPTCERPGSRCHEGDRSDRGEENSQGMIHDFI